MASGDAVEQTRSSTDAAPPAEHDAYLGMGSNLGDRGAMLARAVAALRALAPALRVVAISSVYDSAPQLVTDQPRFLNAVAVVRTSLRPVELLRAVKRIEADLGREPTVRYGPRAIDIDILLYDDLVLSEPGLVVPHARLAERAFALVPLVELDASLLHPALGVPIASLAKALGDQDIHRIGPLPGEMGDGREADMPDDMPDTASPTDAPVAESRRDSV